MPDSTTIASEQLDYPFLLVTHMACVNQQIHSTSLKGLHKLAYKTGVGQRTIEEMEKILAQDEHLLAVEDVVKRVPQEQRKRAIQQIIKMAYLDGSYSHSEQEMVKWLTGIWNSPVEEIQHLGVKVEKFIGDKLDAYNAAHNSQYKRNRPEIWWDDPDYEAAIRQCAYIAREDYTFAESALQEAGATLDDLKKGIEHEIPLQKKTSEKRQADTTKEVTQQLEATKQSLEVEIVKKIESVRESLNAKQRALNYFTIAFLGKTKAGKSTLHAIITGEGADAIGVGKQRTTRFNRVYEWKNIRIIDTPGIGAPDGKTDEEIAQSVIEESDVICYVVTNDSIQETEFGFLQVLKEKAKPLIILLNVKNNLRDSRRLEHFLKDPKKLFAMDGKSGLGGHIERIHRYAKQHYANDYFDVVPVLLLAAQMSREPAHKERKDKLFNASQMQNFLNSIRVSLVEHGAIRRSQTLLGSTVGAIETPKQWVTQQAQNYEQLTNTLKNKRDSIKKNLKKAEKDSLESLRYQIEAVFEDAFNAIPYFAEDYCNSSEESLKHNWSLKLTEIKFEQRIDTAYRDVGEIFRKEVTEALEEVGKELQLIAQLGSGSFHFIGQYPDTFMRHAMRIGGSILGAVGSLLFFTPFAPIGWVFVGVGFLAGLFSGFFKSQRREAITKISNSLSSQLKSQKKTTLQKAEENFKKSCNEVSTNIDKYFEELIKGLDAIATQLETAKKKLDGTANYLNRAYAKRIIDWCCEQHEPLTDEGINRTISKVKRDFGQSMSIQTKSEFKLLKSPDDIKKVLQEDVSILPVKS